MTTNSLIVAAKSALPSLGNNVTYNDAAKMFLSPGYTSAAGNTYQEGLRLSRYLAVDYSIGHGWCHSFLNGVRLYIWDNNKPKWQVVESAWLEADMSNTLSEEENSKLNEKGRIGWTTTYHTGAEVPVYAIGKGAEKFCGRIDNTDIKGKILGE